MGKLIVSSVALLCLCILHRGHGQVAPNSNPSCLSGASAWYRGRLNHTRTGIPCQRWDTNIPHQVRRIPRDGPHHNYCRNPDFDLHGLWCYTTNASVRWEHCELPKCQDDSLLLYTSRNSRGSWISHYPADPEIGFTKPNLQATIYNNTEAGYIWTLTADKLNDRVMFTDYRNNHLVVLHLPTNETSIHMEGMVHGVEGMAYDWISKNLYITDAQKSWVIVTDANFRYYSIIYKNKSEETYAIALHVPARRLFFSTFSSSYATIKSCDLDGNNVTNIITSPLVHDVPSMSVDYIDEKLYWINNDSPRTFIMKANLDGTNITTVYSRRVGRFWGISTYMDTVFLADQIGYMDQFRGRYYRLWILSKEGVPRNSYKFPTKIRALSIYSKNEEYEIPEVVTSNSVCYPNNPCQQICLESYDQRPTCVCSLGYRKVGDTGCELSMISDGFMITSDSVLMKIFQVPLDPSAADEYTMLPIDKQFEKTVEGLALDPNLKMLYWSDRNTSTIYRSHLNGSNAGPVIIGRHAKDIAVDPQTGNVYFVDEAFNYIYVMNKNGRFPKTLVTPRDVTSGYTRIQSIAIDLVNKHIYWAALPPTSPTATTVGSTLGRGPVGEVRRMGLDGSNQQLVFVNIPTPGAMTVSNERNSLFLTSDGSFVYEVSLDDVRTPSGALPTNATSQRIPGSSRIDPINNIKVDGPYMYITELGNNGIRRFNLSDRNDYQEFGSTDFFSPRLMAIYNSSYQYLYADPTSDCAALNCQHLCLQTPSGRYTCACMDNYRFARQSTNNCVHNATDDVPPTYDFCPKSLSISILQCESEIELPRWREPRWTDDKTASSRLHITKPTIAQFYGPGVHIFLYSARDAFGNVGFCSFTVTINYRTCQLSPPPITSEFDITPTQCLKGDNVYQISCKDAALQVQYGGAGGWVNKTMWNLCLPSLEWRISDYSQLSCVKPSTTTAVVTPESTKSTASTTKSYETAKKISHENSTKMSSSSSTEKRVGNSSSMKPSSGGLGGGAIAGIVIAIIILLVLIGAGIFYAQRNRLLPISNPVAMMWNKARDQDLTKNSESVDYKQFY